MNPTGWSNQATTVSCNDANACTSNDKCNGTGGCAGTAYSCNDGLSCTTDTCNGSGGCTNAVNTGCLIGGACVTTGTDNPSNPCQECNPGQSLTSYTAGNNGAVCNDNNACSHTDRCSSGVCDGQDFTCDDGKTCTTNVCNGNNTCSYPIIAGNCLIAGTCYSNNTTRPGNVCQKCTSASAPTSWSNNNVSCDDGNSCTSGDFCGSGSCNASYILDNYEANNSTAGARSITAVDDCSARQQWSLQATIYGPGDFDFFKYRHSDVTFCSMYPYFTLSNIPVGSDLDLYVYGRCANGTTPLQRECNAGTLVFENGAYACRSNATGTTSEVVELDFCCTENVIGTNCTGDDSLDITIEVRLWSGSPTCNQPYTLTWGDN